MKRALIVFIAVLVLSGGALFAQDLRVDFQLNAAAADPANNYFSFIGPIRYMSANKDQVDATTGASKLKSTANFQPYRNDVKGQVVFPDGLRGLFLFAVSPYKTLTDDALAVNKASDGTITIWFVHRGTAYEIVTDRNGRLTFPAGNFRKRNVGFIVGAGPQVLSRDFSRDGTAATIDWNKVWDSRIPGGKEIAAGNNARTGDIVPDLVAAGAMFHWDGALQVTLDRNILKIVGGLNAVKR